MMTYSDQIVYMLFPLEDGLCLCVTNFIACWIKGDSNYNQKFTWFNINMYFLLDCNNEKGPVTWNWRTRGWPFFKTLEVCLVIHLLGFYSSSIQCCICQGYIGYIGIFSIMRKSSRVAFVIAGNCCRSFSHPELHSNWQLYTLLINES